jgi:hypothetical protein
MLATLGRSFSSYEADTIVRQVANNDVIQHPVISINFTRGIRSSIYLVEHLGSDHISKAVDEERHTVSRVTSFNRILSLQKTKRLY